MANRKASAAHIDMESASDNIGALNDRQEARKARNEAQAIEERHIWGEIERGANQAAVIAKRKKGPASSYTEDKGIEIATRLASGQSLHSICKLDHMPHIATIFDWIKNHPSFGERYARARELAAHCLFDQMIDIADDCSKDVLEDGSPNNAAIQRAKLQIDTRARVAGKLAPKVYGERIDALPMVNVTNNSLTIDGRTLDSGQREQLRALLTAAQHEHGNGIKVIDG